MDYMALDPGKLAEWKKLATADLDAPIGDEAFVVAAREVIGALVAEIEALRAGIERVASACRHSNELDGVWTAEQLDALTR